MTIKKDNTDVKETENKDGAPLLDGELESAAGGFSLPYARRWECYECGERGSWRSINDLVDNEMDFHMRRTGHFSVAITWKLLGNEQCTPNLSICPLNIKVL